MVAYHKCSDNFNTNWLLISNKTLSLIPKMIAKIAISEDPDQTESTLFTYSLFIGKCV